MSVPQNLNEVVKSCFKKHGVGNLCCLNCFRDFVLAQAREQQQLSITAMHNGLRSTQIKHEFARDVLLKLIQAKIEDLK